MASHTLAMLGAGTMGAALAARLSSSGAGPILTNLDGRSNATRERAVAANMQHASYADIVARSTIIYSVVPPSEALAIAETIANAYRDLGDSRKLIFVDCNAINPDSAKRIAALFDGTRIAFLDGVIIGIPPSATFNPGIYVCADPSDVGALDEFTLTSTNLGLKIFPLKGEGARIGDASALKMSHAGIVKGTIGLFTTMILAANAASPTTASGLLHSLNHSTPGFVELITRFVPQMLPKAYRFVGEMEEVGVFVGAPADRTFEGLAEVFARVAEAHGQSPQGKEVAQLLGFVEEAEGKKAPN